MIETDEAAAVRAKPTHQELERAIASVPGVEEAQVTLLPDTGKSRLRIRLANGEDAPTVSWAIAATLRERFGIVLDPGAIRPRLSVEPNIPATTPTPADTGSPTSPGDDDSPTSAADAGIASQDAEATGDPDDVGRVDHIDLGDESVVVIGDRILLSEAARAVLSEAIEAGSGTPDADDDPPALTEPTPPQGSAPPRPLSVVGEEAPDPDEASHAGTGSAEAATTDATSAETPAPDATSAEAAAPDATSAETPATDEPAPEATPADDDEPDEPAQEPVVGEASTRPDAPLEGPHRGRSWRSEGSAATYRGTGEDAGSLRPRAAIHNLDTRIDVSDVRVTASLQHRGRSATGEARSVPTRAGILRAVAEATVAALRELTGDRLIVGVDSVSASVAGDPPMATVLVGVVTEAGEETLVGASLVREDPERAVMRATLDALNRRVEPWLEFDLAG